jgi:hypothetical protein
LLAIYGLGGILGSWLLRIWISPSESVEGESFAVAEQPAPSPWRDGPLLLVMLLVFGLAAAFLQTLSTLPLTFRDLYGYRENAIGALLAINALLVAAFRDGAHSLGRE